MTETTEDRTDKRVSVLVGDRICTGCGYNLVGQYVVREPHYALLIVRCPECGTAASVQEYPLLGRWANRVGVVLAVLWFLFLIGSWAGTSGILCAFSLVSGEETAGRYVGFLRDRHQADMEQARRDAAARSDGAPDPAAEAMNPVPAVPGVPPGVQGVIVNVAPPGQRLVPIVAIDDFDVWWSRQDPKQLLADAGGWWAMASWNGAFFLVPLTIAALAFGTFWSVVLIQLRRRWVLLWGVMVILLAGVFLMFSVMGWIDPTPGWYYRAARGQMAPAAAFATLAWGGMMLSIGMLVGRAVTRGLVRALLPPGLRNALAILWTAEGRPLPGGSDRLGDHR